MLYSMTGFSRLTHQTELAEFTIELKSVNHRFLDLSIFLPEGFGQLDILWRNYIRDKLNRGRIECSLKVLWQSQMNEGLPLDRDLIHQLLTATRQINEMAPNLSSASAVDILKWPGVINPALFNLNHLQQNIMDALTEAVDILINVRAVEGDQIKLFIQQRLTKINEVVAIVRAELPKLIELQQQRIQKKFAEAQVQLDPERLAQEMVLFAQRMDVAEELDRLTMHIKAVQDLLNQGGRIGRKLDFMMQELNRETNTLGSKSLSADITQQVVSMKVYIEEMREQIQNLE